MTADCLDTNLIFFQVYRKCYGQHVGFSMFMENILLSLARKVIRVNWCNIDVIVLLENIQLQKFIQNDIQYLSGINFFQSIDDAISLFCGCLCKQSVKMVRARLAYVII